MHLREFADESGEPEAKQLLHQLALEAKNQHERLAARLASLGGSPSVIHGLFSQLLGLGSKASQLGQEKNARTTQSLIAAFATEHANAALCESIANMSEAAGDNETAELARAIQGETSESSQKIWRLLPIAATEAYNRSTENDVQK